MPRSTALGSGGDPLIWLGLAAATLFFVATGAVAYLNFQTLKQDSALVVHSGDTLTALEDVLSTVKDAETGQRGYLLTDNESYLDPYNAAVEEIGPRLDALQRLTPTIPTQQDRLATLKQHIGAKLAELKQHHRSAPDPGTGRGARRRSNRSRQTGHGRNPRRHLSDGAARRSICAPSGWRKWATPIGGRSSAASSPACSDLA